MARTDKEQDAYLASKEYADKQAALAEERRRESGFYQGTSTSAKGGPGAPGPRAYTEEGYREAGGYRGNSRTGGAGPGAPAYGSPESIGLPPSNPNAPKLIDDPNDDPNNPGPTLPIEPGYVEPKYPLPGVPLTPVKPVPIVPVKPVEPIPKKPLDDPKDNPAYAALLAAMSAYGIEGLAGTLLKIRTDYPEITSEDLLSLLRFDTRYNAGYLKRFAGNAKLTAAGKPTLDEKTYFANEAAYAKIFKAYGVDRFANRDQYATLIGNDLAPTEVSTRVGMAYDRVLNADSNVSLALRKYASSLTTGDLVAAMLDPVNQLPELERKITSAEIGGQALNQGLQLSEQSRMTELVNAKVDREAAMVGYKNVATVLPEATKFGNIYGESKFVNQKTGMAEKLEYTQSTGEEEYLLDNVEAQKKRLYLRAKELASFDASAGNAPGAYSTSYLKKSSAAGLV